MTSSVQVSRRERSESVRQRIVISVLDQPAKVNDFFIVRQSGRFTITNRATPTTSDFGDSGESVPLRLIIFERALPPPHVWAWLKQTHQNHQTHPCDGQFAQGVMTV